MEELQEFDEQKETNNFDLKSEIYKYLAYWHWLLIGLLLGGLVAYLYNRYSIPEYRSEATMMINQSEDKNMLSALPSSGGGSILSMDKTSIGNHIETLRSKSLVANVIDELDQNISYFVEGNVITVEAYDNIPVLINFATPDSVVHETSKTIFLYPQSENDFLLEDESVGYRSVHEIGDVIKLDGLEFEIEWRGIPRSKWFAEQKAIIIKIAPIRQVANEYIAKLEIQKKGNAEDILILSMVQESPQKSEDFLNNLMFEFNLDGVQDKREVAEKTESFVQDRLSIITSELDSVEGGMADFKRENVIMDVVSGAEEFQNRSSEVEEEIFELQTQLLLIQSVKEMLNNQEEYSLLPSNIGIEEGGISGIIENYNELILERNSLLRTSTAQNPVVLAVTEQIDSLRANLQENMQSAIRSINVRLKEFSQRERKAKAKFSTFPGLERGIRGIERQQQIKEQLYIFLLEKREEAAISSAATSSVAKIIDPAYTLPSPVGPKPIIILIGGLFVGLLIPIIVILVKNTLDTKIHSKADLQGLTKDIPFIGEIPKLEKGEEEVIRKNDRSVLAESFRILRTNLNYLMKGRGEENQKVIFVTSSIKGEGKTFVTYNLSRTLASSGKKVLLIGADIRNPQLHRYARGMRKGFKGLSEYLYDDKLSIQDIVSSNSEDRLAVDVILSGRIPPNPAELLINNRMEKLLEEARELYDYILIDTAPTMLVTDTLLISPYADTTIYVTRAGYTEKGILNFANELYKEGKLKGMALVVNDVDQSSFGYASKYGYSYTYGYGAERKGWFSTWYNRTFKNN